MKKKEHKHDAENPDTPRDSTCPPLPAGETEPAEAAAGKLQAERDDLLARLQRVSADYLNYQKRAQRDVAEAREFANEQLIRALLPVLDDMERALQAARENHGETDPLFQGMQLVHDKALEVLGRFGLTVVEAAGKAFDPEQHAAVMQQPSDAHPPQTVIRELQKGYRLKGRTIRPSSVVVSRAPEPPAPEAEEEQAE